MYEKNICDSGRDTKGLIDYAESWSESGLTNWRVIDELELCWFAWRITLIIISMRIIYLYYYYVKFFSTLWDFRDYLRRNSFRPPRQWDSVQWLLARNIFSTPGPFTEWFEVRIVGGVSLRESFSPSISVNFRAAGSNADRLHWAIVVDYWKY